VLHHASIKRGGADEEEHSPLPGQETRPKLATTIDSQPPKPPLDKQAIPRPRPGPRHRRSRTLSHKFARVRVKVL